MGWIFCPKSIPEQRFKNLQRSSNVMVRLSLLNLAHEQLVGNDPENIRIDHL